METRKILVSGMKCEGCADSLARLFENEPGVSKVTVSYPLATADLTYDPDQVTTDRLSEIVKGAGFEIS